MNRLALFGGAAALGLAVILAGRGDATGAPSSLAAPGNPMADLHDLYAWMAADGAKVNLVMTVSPGDPGGRSFGPGVQYVFHVTSLPGTREAIGPTTGGVTTRVVCTFASATSAQCWVIGPSSVKDYVTGDPSNPAGTTSSSGKVRLFAGRRSDPTFFNLQGWRNATASLRQMSVPINQGNCPTLDNTTAGQLRTTLSTAQATTTAPCPSNQVDCFATANAMALVLQVDKSLLNTQGNVLLSVWGATHQEP